MPQLGPASACSFGLALLCLAGGSGRTAEIGPEEPMAHIRALQEIAGANGGNRAAGTRGYEVSVEYVSEALRRAGYQVRIEEFTYPYNEERSPPRLLSGAARVPAPEGEVRSFTYSGPGDITAPLRSVDLTLPADGPVQPSTSACEAADFSGFERGAIALVRRGTCPFFVKVQNAVAAGANGVIVMNEGTSGQTGGFSASLGRPMPIPVVGVSYPYGRELAAKADRPEDATVRLTVDITTSTGSSKNVLADAPAGENDRRPVVMVGAHLDSVRDGPGINDNGSGVAAALTAASWVAEASRTGSIRLRFGFWGAEEIGLVGSRHYASRLSEEERKQMPLYINLDMVGSPNFARIVLAEPAADGTAAVASNTMLEHFAARSLAAERRAAGPLGTFSTDMASFRGRGIPVVGLYTGSAELKREDQVAGSGGTAGQPHDSCYHRACDTSDNVSAAVLTDMAGALTDALFALLRSELR